MWRPRYTRNRKITIKRTGIKKMGKERLLKEKPAEIMTRIRVIPR